MGDRVSEPCCVSCALARMSQAVDYLSTVDITSLPVNAQAEVLTSLAAMKPQLAAAARDALLAAFVARSGPKADEQGAAPAGQRWLRESVGGPE